MLQIHNSSWVQLTNDGNHDFIESSNNMTKKFDSGRNKSNAVMGYVVYGSVSVSNRFCQLCQLIGTILQKQSGHTHMSGI